MRQVSKKRAASATVRNKVRKIVIERADGICEARLSMCQWEGTDVHELKTRGRGGDPNDESNCILLCRLCHRYITDNPAWSEENGFVLPSWAGIAEEIAASRARLEFRNGRA
jgi:hypothetical protein